MKRKLGRTTDKPGRKSTSKVTLTDEQRAAIRAFGKYARHKQSRLIVETADYAGNIELLIRI